MARELLFSLTKADFRLEFMRAGGKGGQKQNKTSSACRITHLASGAVGVARDERSQSQNRKLAFQRLVDSQRFKAWLKIAVAEATLDREALERRVDALMRAENLKIETYEPDHA